MKRRINILRCIAHKIKKFFFNKEKAVIPLECDKASGLIENRMNNQNEEEYLNSYQSITRWQTI